MHKESSVILASADHLSGELLGAAISDILAMGAWGAQAIATVTKKGRPGTLLVIEPGSQEENIALYLARELKIGGYQRIRTEHAFHQARFVTKRMRVRVDGAIETFDLRVKQVGPEGALLYSSVEADDARMICEELERRLNVTRPFHLVKGALDLAASEDGDEAIVDL